jgi:hypothetical protein
MLSSASAEATYLPFFLLAVFLLAVFFAPPAFLVAFFID